MKENARPRDFVIVGGGTAGCVLARRLSDAGARVVVLESGPSYHPRHSIPLPSLNHMRSRCASFNTTPQEGLGGREIELLVGNIVGGGSSINAMLYTRGNPADYDAWERLAGPRWSYANVLRLYKKAERFQGGASEYHGETGPIAVSAPRYLSPFSRAFLEACEELGLPRNDDMNGAKQEGFGPYHVTQERGLRSGVATEYLRPVRRRASFELETNVTVTRLGFSGTRATWVEGVRDGTACRWNVDGEVIVCAGALRTPQLLLLSGVGPEEELRRHGIRCILRSAAVGQQLTDHVRVPMLFGSTLRPPLQPEDFRSPLGLLRTAAWGLAYAFARRGVLATNLCEVGGFVAAAGSELPNLQFVTHFVGLEPLRSDVVDLEPCLLRPRSRGTVTLESADPHAAPKVDPAYLTHDDDVAALVEGVTLARALAATRAMRRAGVTDPLSPAASARTNAEKAAFVRSSASTCFHPTGTCAMGPSSSELAVVGPDLRVHGLSNVRVVDASVFPDLVAGNTCAPVVMVAENAAEMILQ